ncbi:MAG: acetyltransferase, ribosomal protein N-acetylase [Acidimicrobiaceae bacterium]|nr:acetyltransferase, ribosomal protein N-acetylase [Acidimicrobiaceae bacterium]
MQVIGRAEIEVVYALRSEFWGCGYAVTVSNALIDIADQAGLCEEVVALTLTTNRQSWRVMQKTGFRFDQEFDCAGAPHVLYRRPVHALGDGGTGSGNTELVGGGSCA